MIRRRDDHHQVRCDPVRPVGAGGLPIREVTDLHQHRNPDLVDIEADGLVAHRDVGNGDFRQRLWHDCALGNDHVDAILLDTGLVDGDVDPLPILGPAASRDRSPVARVLEPARAKFEPGLARVRAFRDHDGLYRQRHNDVAIANFVDVPRPAHGYRLELARLIGFGDRLVGPGQVITDPELLQVWHADGGVAVGVAQLADRIRAVGGHRRCSDEVIRRRARRLEEQALATADAAVCPVREEHQRHRRAVSAVVAVVLPQRPAATVVGILADRRHRVDERLVLSVRTLALIAGEVVHRPTVGEPASARRPLLIQDQLVTADTQAQRISARRCSTAGEEVDLERDGQHQQDHDQGEHGRERAADRGGLRSRQRDRRAGAPLATLDGDRVTDPRPADEPDDAATDLDDADHHQHVAEQVDERQDPRVPQQPDQRDVGVLVLGETGQQGKGDDADADPRTAELAPLDGGDEADEGEHEHDPVQRDVEVEKHLPVRIVCAARAGLVLHVGHVGRARRERDDPERGQQAHRHQGGEAVLEPGLVHPDEGHQRDGDQDEDRDDPVTQHREGQDHRRSGAVLTRLESTGEESESEYRQRQSDTERELSGHRALDGAAEDAEVLGVFEEEDQRGNREQLGDREHEPAQPPERPATDRQCHDAEHHDELERDSVRQHDVERNDHQRRDHHVEPVHREAVVPIRVPTVQPEVAQKMIAEVRRTHDVSTHVAAGGGVARGDQVPVHDVQRDDGRHHQEGECGQRLDRSFEGPRGVDPVERTAQDASCRASEPALAAAIIAGPGGGRAGVVERVTGAHNCGRYAAVFGGVGEIEIEIDIGGVRHVRHGGRHSRIWRL